jgi:hypothetical protein
VKKTLQAIADSVAPLLESSDPRIKLEAIKVLASLHGILVPDSLHLTDPKAEYASRYIREVVVGRLVKNNKLRREINRRQFLKRRIAQLLTDGSDPIKLAEFQKELAESLKNRKRVPLSEMPNGAPQSTVDASAAPATPIDPAVMAKGLALAQSYLRSLENNQESNAE